MADYEVGKPSRSRYLTPRSAAFFDGIAREVVYIGGQSLVIYPMIGDAATKHDKESIYGEYVNKRYKAPIRVPCFLDFGSRSTEEFEGIGFEEGKTFFSAFIHRNELVDLNYHPQEDDIVIFQNDFFRIVDINDAEMYHGIEDYKYHIQIDCSDARINEYELGLLEPFYDDKPYTDFEDPTP